MFHPINYIILLNIKLFFSIIFLVKFMSYMTERLMSLDPGYETEIAICLIIGILLILSIIILTIIKKLKEK